MKPPSYLLRWPVRPAFAALALLLGAALPGRAAEAPGGADRVIQLPPLEVSAIALNAKPWSYARAPGVEVLARTSPRVTREFLEAQFRLQQLVALFLPRELQARSSVPEVLILTTPGAGGSLPPEILAEVRERAATREAADGQPAAVSTFDNLRLADVDATVVYAVLDEVAFTGSRVRFTRDQLRFLLDRRTPRLPEWFLSAVFDLFEQMELRDNTVTFGPVGWTPKEEVERIVSTPDYPPALLSMDDLLVRPCPPFQGETLAAARTWRAQATLFVRWMLESETRRPRLWRLAARAAEQPMTDELCREIVGLDFVDLRDRLSDYLRPALRRRGETELRTELVRLPEVEVRTATPAEVGRLKGDWERMAANWVRARYPQFAGRYVFQARRTLTQAIERGERDPQLLAVLGLLECDLADDVTARPLLEAAVAAKITRPRVYFELARVRYAEALAQLTPERKLLHSTQVNAVLEPFKSAGAQEPPLLESHRLIAEVWSRSTATLGPEQLAWCDRALKLFPHDAGLIYNIAVIYVVHGNAPEAAVLAKRGLALSETPAAKARFAKLAAHLNGAPAEATPARTAP